MRGDPRRCQAENPLIPLSSFPEPTLYAGLTSTPFNSGGSEREQGISKSGNRRLRGAMGELAWLWLRYQPDSALAKWFRDRMAGANGRMKKVLLVALARKLLIALWRYVTNGVVPDGAVLEAAS